MVLFSGMSGMAIRNISYPQVSLMNNTKTYKSNGEYIVIPVLHNPGDIYGKPELPEPTRTPF